MTSDCLGIRCPKAQQHAHLRASAVNYANLLAVEKNHSHHLQATALVDPVTGVYNKRGLVDNFAKEVAKFQRFGRVCSLLLVRLDGFADLKKNHEEKFVNATLTTIAETIKNKLRLYDNVHMLEDDFVVLLPETNAVGAHAVAERIRSAIAQLSMAPGTTPMPFGVTVNIGIAQRDQKDITLKTLLDMATQAEAQTEASGANSCQIYSGTTSP